MELKDRIMYIMSKERLTASIFADTIGVQRSSISHILSGRNKPSLEFIQKIATSFPKYNITWLFMGTGQALGTETNSRATIKAKIQENTNLFTSVNNQINQQSVESKPEIQEVIVENETQTKTVNDEDFTPYKLHKKVKQIVIFYTDSTFSTYTPSNED